MTEPPLQEMAIRGTHDWVMRLVAAEVPAGGSPRVLDIGAGQGALSARLSAAGYAVAACEAEPAQFRAAGVECRPCDASGRLPFGDGEFDVALAVEVLEHIDGHDRFFAEAARVLKPGGTLLFTTPNILSLKSRLTFLFTGSFYSFPVLTAHARDQVSQHVSPFTLNRYTWMLSQHGFRVDRVTTDKMQRSSRWLGFLAPLVRLGTRLAARDKAAAREQASRVALYGRKLLVVARRDTH